MRHVPNLLSVARLIAAPYVFWLLAQEQWSTVLAWFAVIGFTDFLDGTIARRFHATSKLGAMLDPVADKVLLSGSFVTLLWNQSVPMWLAGLVLGRDVLILLFAVVVLVWLPQGPREFPPSQAGKLSTFFQIAYILCFVSAHAFGLEPLILQVVGYVVLAVTGWSAVDYAGQARRYLQRVRRT
jgi:cardiolipin synthase (CMP-forming)